MFGGNTANQVFPFFLEENPHYYDSNESTQLRLFGNSQKQYPFNNVSAACNTEQIKLKVSDNNGASSLNPPIKRSSESADIATQNNLPISFHNLFRDESDRSRSIPGANTVSTGLRLSCDDAERHSSTSSRASMSSFPFSTAVLDRIGLETEHQNEEFNGFLRFQEEQFAEGLREMKQRHEASFMNIIGRELSRKLRAKELEIESMNQRNRELADQIRQAAAEAQAWQQRSQCNESIVLALRTSLQQTMAQAAAAAAANQGREGCGESEVDDAASSFYPNSVKDGKKRMLIMACRVCNEKESCMLLLPCRHLRLCRDCDSMADACPVCFARKTASVEVYMP